MATIPAVMAVLSASTMAVMMLVFMCGRATGFGQENLDQVGLTARLPWYPFWSRSRACCKTLLPDLVFPCLPRCSCVDAESTGRHETGGEHGAV